MIKIFGIIVILDFRYKEKNGTDKRRIVFAKYLWLYISNAIF